MPSLRRISKIFTSESIFFQNILHFFLSTHLIPLIDYSFPYLPKQGELLVTIATTFGENIATKLNELPKPSSKDFIQLSARILINGCYEILKENPIKEKIDPETLEFFRHIRNASSHNGRFTFQKNEPKRKAIWKRLEITKDLDGTELFDFMAIGDIILFLQDIEN